MEQGGPTRLKQTKGPASDELERASGYFLARRRDTDDHALSPAAV